MATRQYIGARYVPIFDGNWDNTKDYEPLVIVSYQGNSYTSRTFVPHGTDITNETYWALTGNYNAQVEAYREEVREISNDVYSAIATPQMYGAIGDGINNDTEAFQELANTDRNIFIPKGDYKITEIVTLPNVVADKGNYILYKPEYIKPLKLDLASLSYINKGIELPVVKSYEESVCVINNKYYVITNEYDDSNNGICVYDASFNLIDHEASSNATVGVCNNCTTDGSYLYIDYDNGYHAKYSPADLTTPMLLVEADYHFTCYDNGTLYAVKINATSAEVSKLDDTLSVLSDTITINNVVRQTLQSCTIYDGQLYIPTTHGTFYVIDLISKEVLGVDYQQTPFEIEAFFRHNNQLCAIGHLFTVGGVFNISVFNGGISNETIKFIEVDCSKENFSPTLVNPNYRSAIYHVINGYDANIMPANDCEVLWMGDNIVCYSRTNNSIHYWNGSKWVYMRGYISETIPIETGVDIVLAANGTLYLQCTTCTLQEATHHVSVDLSTIYQKLGLSDSYEYRMSMIGVTNGVIPMTSDVYAVQVLIKKTEVVFYTKSLLSIDQSINCRLAGRVLLA